MDVATLPIRMNSGTTTSSGEDAMVKVSDPSSPIAASQPRTVQMPIKPTRNIAKATGMRRASSVNRAVMPIRPMDSTLILMGPFQCGCHGPTALIQRRVATCPKQSQWPDLKVPIGSTPLAGEANSSKGSA